MQATPFEYRFRSWIQVLIYALGFGLVPLVDAVTPGLADALSLTAKSTWLVVTSIVARQRLLTFSTASVVLLLVALLFTGLGAWIRLWGAAYVGPGVVLSPAMPASNTASGNLLADGPYRRTRNPLYLGTLLHTVGIAILMPPAGAVLAITLLWVFQIRLALAEEPLLFAQFGQPYLDYQRAVPRFLPVPAPHVPAAGARPHWLQSFFGEFYFIGVFLTLAIFGWQFNATPLTRGILISLGLAIIARAFLPTSKSTA